MQFGQAISQFQLVQAKFADMFVAIDTSRTYLHRALTMCDNMELTQAGRGEIHKISAAALIACSRAGSLATNEAVQIFGGSGYMRDTEVNRLYRSSKVMEIAAGTQEIRQVIIAKELLRG